MQRPDFLAKVPDVRCCRPMDATDGNECQWASRHGIRTVGQGGKGRPGKQGRQREVAEPVIHQ